MTKAAASDRGGQGVYLDLADAIKRLGENTITERYENLIQMYEKITGENPYQTPMRIYPAPHYTMGGLWVDYNLMSNLEGLFVLGEANFSDHGANRLGASALMQGLADGYFILPYTIAHYLAQIKPESGSTNHPEFEHAKKESLNKIKKMLSIRGKKTVDEIHRELGKILWEHCGMSRSAEGLAKALSLIPSLRKEFWSNVTILGSEQDLNQSLEKAGRAADFLEFGELLCRDALERNESCGGHFRMEYQTEDGEARRDDQNFAHVAAWEYQGESAKPIRHQEALVFEEVQFATRSYK